MLVKLCVWAETAGDGDGSVARSTCARNVCMQVGARAVLLQCTSWTSMTANSTHAHDIRMRIMKCIAHVSMFTYHEATTLATLRMEKDNIFNRQTLAIKNCANYKIQNPADSKSGL